MVEHDYVANWCILQLIKAKFFSSKVFPMNIPNPRPCLSLFVVLIVFKYGSPIFDNISWEYPSPSSSIVISENSWTTATFSPRKNKLRRLFLGTYYFDPSKVRSPLVLISIVATSIIIVPMIVNSYLITLKNISTLYSNNCNNEWSNLRNYHAIII